MAATNNSQGGRTFGDAKKHQAVAEMYNRLRIVIEIFCKSEAKNNALRLMQNFVPHLKRTDRDAGGLPFYSVTPESRKGNRNHCLICVVSYTIQKFWDYREPSIETSEEDLLDLLNQIIHLERIAKCGLSEYRVHGKYPVFRLVHVDDLERIEKAEEAADAELAERLAKENEEAVKAEAEGATTYEEDQIADQKETATIQVMSGMDTLTEMEVPVKKDNDLSTEAADACNGECDSCTDRVCDNQLGSLEDQASENAELAEDEGGPDGEGDELDNMQEYDDHDHAQDVAQEAAAGDVSDEVIDESGEDTGDEGEAATLHAIDELENGGGEEITEGQQEDDAIEEQIDKKQEEDGKAVDSNEPPPMPKD